MNYIVMDMEWNQAVSRRRLVTAPVTLNGEIVQIGAVKINENLEELDRFNINIKPKYYTTMHPTVRDLTGITMDSLKSGAAFPEAIEAFRKWCGEDYAYITWSMSDLSILEANLRIYEMPVDWLPACYDAQKLFDRQFIDDDHQHSLGYAMYIFEEKPLEAHDALHDAVNTVTVLRHMMEGEKLTVDYLDVGGDEPMYYTHMRIEPHMVERDTDLSTFPCFDCDEDVICRDWAVQTSHQLVSVGQCANGHRFFVRLRFKKLRESLFEVYRVVYDLDDELMEVYRSLKK